MSVAETIESKLTQALSPLRIEVVDESDLHIGHAGARPEGETHFRVEIVSTAFEGKSRVECQRLVYGALGEEMAGPIHALSLKTLSPDENP